MKALNKFNSKQEYGKYRTTERDSQKSHVCLINGKIKYYNSDSPFYLEAIEDLEFSISGSRGNYIEYSFDKINWMPANNAVFLKSGQRIYLKNTDSSGLTYYKQCNITGNFKLGGIDNNGWLSLFANNFLISLEDLIFKSNMSIANCENLIQIPYTSQYVASAFCNSYSYGYSSFKNCPNVEGPVAIFAGELSRYANLGVDFSNCDKVTSVTVFAKNYNSKPGNCQGGSGGASIKVSPNVSGIFTTNSVFLQKLALSNIRNTLPETWQILLYDENLDKYYIKFAVDGTYYNADDNMTWEQWVNSDYNLYDFKVESDNITYKGNIVYLGSDPVLTSDVIKCMAKTDYSAITL